jgi:hypothetical protein
VPRGREPGHVDPDFGQVARGDIGVNAVDPGQHPGEQEPVMVIKTARQRLLEFGNLLPQARPGQWPTWVSTNAGS